MSHVKSLFLMVTMVASLLWTASAHAHAAPHSFVLLDFRSNDVDAELRLPISELEAVFRDSLSPDGPTLVESDGVALRSYVQQHVQAETRDGTPWTAHIEKLDSRVEDGTSYVVAFLRLVPPEGASAQTFVLHDDVILHEVVNHTAWVALRSDFANGVASGEPAVLGVLRASHTSMVIDRAGGGNARGVRSLVRLGMQHIAEGTDHLLFLLALLLPAPLLFNRGTRRWGEFAGLGPSLRTLLRVVTAFTLGHSITLLAGVIGWVNIPSRPVETLIAVSIFVSAIHAIRPIFPGREAWVAAGFGLVHGLAFAGSLGTMHLDAYRLALAVCGFNVGIEIMQLFVVALAFPWMILIARTRFHPLFRTAGATAAAVAALAWVGERAFHFPNPIDAIVTRAAGHPLPMLAGLASLAAAATIANRIERGPAHAAVQRAELEAPLHHAPPTAAE